MKKLQGQVVVVTGGSRGIGREIALKCAEQGADIVLAAKTVEAHPKLKGTIFSVAKEVEEKGVRALPIQLDVRDDAAIAVMMEKAAQAFGKIDILVNNASAINLTPTIETPMKRFDLMFGVNVRGTFACSQAAIPYLIQSKHAHILNLSPPLNMDAKWFKNHLAYTMSKYGMSMCTLGLAEELKEHGVAVNSLWPKTTIATAAVEFNFPKEIYHASRTPAIMADAALAILEKDPRTNTGNFYIDENVLHDEGVSDFKSYAINPDAPLFTDLYVEA